MRIPFTLHCRLDNALWLMFLRVYPYSSTAKKDAAMPARDTSPQKQPSDSTRSPSSTQGTTAQGLADFTPLPPSLQRTQVNQRQMRPTDVVYLQRAIGNQAVSRLLAASPTIQPKLKVGPVGDAYEQEADRVARQVMAKPAAPRAQRKEEEGEGIHAAAGGVQRTVAPPKITPLVQRASHGNGCKCKACSSVQRHHDEDEHLQRHHDEEEKLQRTAHGKGCKCNSCSSVQRHHSPEEERHVQRSTPAKDGSFETDSNLEGQVRNLAGRGRPMNDGLRSEMEGRFGGADFSNVRLHTGAEANTLNRSMSAHAFTHGNNIAFASGQYNPGSQHGKQLLAHELAHTIQQTGGVQRSANGGHGRGCGCTSCRPATPKVDTPKLSPSKIGGSLQRSGIIQRHASFEHRMLGDLDPDDLERLGQWQDPDPTNDNGEVDIAGAAIRKANILHVIQQEMNRLKAWQRTPPTGATQEDADELMGDDAEWQVKLVAIPSLTKPQTPPLIVTYGELNTLADFYGSVQELKSADPVKRKNVVQSVRNQSFEKLLGIYMEMNQKTIEVAKQELGVSDLTFAGSFNITDAVSGEVAQMMVDKKGELDKYSAYGSTLARNACHFAPESWHSWEDYHEKARKLAKDAYDLSQQAQQQDAPQDGNQVQEEQQGGGNSNNNNKSMFGSLLGGVFGNSAPPQSVSVKNGKAPTLKDQVEEKINEALLTNGFGDHYLQDSYAAGHLINKTQIMQWFVQWLDKNPDKVTYTSDTTWRQYQAMAYMQDGISARGQYEKFRIGRQNIKGQEVSTARNPQMVENTQEAPKGQNIGWEGRFEMLGLKLPGSIKANSPALKLLIWLQRNSNIVSSWTWKELKDKSKPAAPKGWFAKLTTIKEVPPHNIPEAQLQRAMESLIEDNIIYMSSGNRYDYAKLARGEDVEFFKDDSKFELRKEYVVSMIGGGNFNKAASDAEKGDMGAYEKMTKATIYKDYVNFMKDGFLQKSTNALHDYFCKKGLYVQGADGHTVFKIYGDNAMLNKESSKGVKESAQTSRKSRDSIMQIAMNGREDEDHTTSVILDRFPNRVRLDDGSMVTLDEWHNEGELKKVAERDIFPTLNSAAEVVVGMTSGKGLGAITKDEEVHGSEAF
jgi:hypothetical protein